MIPEWFMDRAYDFLAWFLSLFGDAPDLGWLEQVSDWMGEIGAAAGGLGAWIPWWFVNPIVTTTVLLWGAGFSVKGIRWIVGLLPTMGGG